MNEKCEWKLTGNLYTGEIWYETSCGYCFSAAPPENNICDCGKEIECESYGVKTA